MHLLDVSVKRTLENVNKLKGVVNLKLIYLPSSCSKPVYISLVC